MTIPCSSWSKFVRRSLAPAYRIVIADTGAGIDRVRTSAPDVILLDLHLPDGAWPRRPLPMPLARARSAFPGGAVLVESNHRDAIDRARRVGVALVGAGGNGEKRASVRTYAIHELVALIELLFLRPLEPGSRQDSSVAQLLDKAEEVLSYRASEIPAEAGVQSRDQRA